MLTTTHQKIATYNLKDSDLKHTELRARTIKTAQDIILIVWIINLHQILNVCCLLHNKVFLCKWGGGKWSKAYETAHDLKIRQNGTVLAQFVWKIEENHLRVAGDTGRPDCNMS